VLAIPTTGFIAQWIGLPMMISLRPIRATMESYRR
jgi:hypothetical protein